MNFNKAILNSLSKIIDEFVKNWYNMDCDWTLEELKKLEQIAWILSDSCSCYKTIEAKKIMFYDILSTFPEKDTKEIKQILSMDVSCLPLMLETPKIPFVRQIFLWRLKNKI